MVALMALTAIGVSNCGSDNPAKPTPVANSLQLSFANLKPLQGYVFEAWAVNQGTYTSLGKFTILNGIVVDTLGNAITSFPSSLNLKTVSRIAITLEERPDPDPAPSAIELLTANVGSSDTLDLGFKVDYSGRHGNMILITPSDGGGAIFSGAASPDTSNPFGGVWFVSKPWGEPEFGLTLLAPPAGWKYEGWYMDQNLMFTSTGKFTDAGASDEMNDHLANADPVEMAKWTYPGEDFLVNPPMGQTYPLDLRGGMAFVTLEPEPDNDPMAPFTLFTLYCKDIADTMHSNLTYPMDTPPMPTGTAVLK